MEPGAAGLCRIDVRAAQQPGWWFVVAMAGIAGLGLQVMLLYERAPAEPPRVMAGVARAELDPTCVRGERAYFPSKDEQAYAMMRFDSCD